MEQWAVMMRCPKGHKFWVGPDSLGYFTPPKKECVQCVTKAAPKPPKFGWLEKRRMHRELSAFLRDQATRPDSEA